MTSTKTSSLIAFLIVLLLAFGSSLTFAYAHSDADHAETEDSGEIEKMEKTIALLTQVIALLKQKAALVGAEVEHHHEADDETHDEGELEKLTISVEVHSYKTHVHIQEPGKEEDSFVVEDIEYTDEEAVIAAIANETGLSIHDIEEVVTFPVGALNEKGDSVGGHDEEEGEDTSGIHIMSDGKIMWGNGAEVTGATITSDNKVKLADGTIITPAFDLR